MTAKETKQKAYEYLENKSIEKCIKCLEKISDKPEFDEDDAFLVFAFYEEEKNYKKLLSFSKRMSIKFPQSDEIKVMYAKACNICGEFKKAYTILTPLYEKGIMSYAFASEYLCSFDDDVDKIYDFCKYAITKCTNPAEDLDTATVIFFWYFTSGEIAEHKGEVFESLEKFLEENKGFKTPDFLDYLIDYLEELSGDPVINDLIIEIYEFFRKYIIAPSASTIKTIESVKETNKIIKKLGDNPTQEEYEGALHKLGELAGLSDEDMDALTDLLMNDMYED